MHLYIVQGVMSVMLRQSLPSVIRQQFSMGVIFCHTCSLFHIELTNCSKKLLPGPRVIIYLMCFPTLLGQKQSSEEDTKFSQVSQLINTPFFIIFINKVDYNGTLICILSGCYKILHTLLRTHDSLDARSLSEQSPIQ